MRNKIYHWNPFVKPCSLTGLAHVLHLSLVWSCHYPSSLQHTGRKRIFISIMVSWEIWTNGNLNLKIGHFKMTLERNCVRYCPLKLSRKKNSVENPNAFLPSVNHVSIQLRVNGVTLCKLLSAFVSQTKLVFRTHRVAEH